MPTYKLLSSSSPKIDKSNKIQDKYFSRIMYLAPSDLADGVKTTCPYSKIAMCEEPCLNTAGLGGVYSSIQNSRIRWNKEILIFKSNLILVSHFQH